MQQTPDRPAVEAPIGRARPQRSRRGRRLLFILIAVLVVIGGIEVVAAIAFRIVRGERFSYARMAQVRQAVGANAAGGEGAQAAAQRAIRSPVVLHPYLGFVYDVANNAARGQRSIDGVVDRYGFMSAESSMQTRSPDRFVVAIIGGSVAYQLAILAVDALREELARTRSLAGRRIEVVPLALGGFKQPQQLMALTYLFALGSEFDCVINVDGFNEVGLVEENTSRGMAPFFPRGWHGLARTATPIEEQILVGRLALARDARAAAARTWAGVASWSVTAQLLWLLGDRAREREVAAAEVAIQQHRTDDRSFAVVGPGVDAPGLPHSLASMAELWARSSTLMRDACAARGIHYFHFLQPNQYVPDAKPIGDAERAVAVLPFHPYRTGVIAGYPMLAAQTPALRGSGVPFGDLRDVFRGHPEPIYVDTCCHLTPAGYAIVARAIGERVRLRLDRRAGVPVALTVSPREVLLDDPRRSIELRVTARAADGTEFDVDDEVEFASRDPATIEVSRFGEVRARRRGTSELIVRCRGEELTLPVRASWPAVVTSSDGLGVCGRPAPRLLLAQDPPTPTSPTVALRCVGAPAQAAGLLVLSTHAIDPGLTAMPTDLDTVMLPFPAPGAGAAEATVQIDLPKSGVARQRGRAVYLRAFFPTREPGLVAVSEVLILTVD